MSGSARGSHLATSAPQSPGPAIALLLAAVAIVVASGCRPGGGAGDAQGTQSDEWERPAGRWSPLEEGRLTGIQIEEMKRLQAIGYLSGSMGRPDDAAGVTVNDESRAWEGINFYLSGHAPGAFLMDMRGAVVHRWHHDFMSAWRRGPGGDLPASSKGAGFWRRAQLLENGDVIAIFDGHAMIRVDRDSRLVWARFGGFHHDLDVMPDGRIYTLLREPAVIPALDPDLPVLEEFIVVLDREGTEIGRVSQLEAFRKADRLDLLEGMRTSGDIFHTNTIEVLDGRLAGRDPAFAAGNVLICIRELALIAIIDMDSRRVVWGMRGPWSKPHQPTVLDNGNLMIFDNGTERGFSRVLEFDPVTGEIAWSYEGDAENTFFTPSCGSSQRLPNGNTLISETDRGRAVEVTPDGDIVWEFINPAQAGEARHFIASLFEVVRIPPERTVGWFADRPEAGP